jgi:hypothetical protein
MAVVLASLGKEQAAQAAHITALQLGVLALPAQAVARAVQLQTTAVAAAVVAHCLFIAVVVELTIRISPEPTVARAQYASCGPVRHAPSRQQMLAPHNSGA